VRLTKDLLFDLEGSLKFKPELWHDIHKVILPSVTEKVGYILIPCVEYTDDMLDLVLNNLTLWAQPLPKVCTISSPSSSFLIELLIASLVSCLSRYAVGH
jgi:hypothetical protein